jgi:uncharacterized protein
MGVPVVRLLRSFAARAVILESVVTTADAQGAINIAPMGPYVEDESFSQIVLKPFRSSRTLENLQQTGRAVVHVSDDVELIAAAAIGHVDPGPLVEPLLGQWYKLVDCCCWFAVEIQSWQDDPQRPQACCRIVHRGVQRPMFGFNRGKHAVVEAAILATRVELLGRSEVQRQMQALLPLVEKTGGAAEHRAWRRLEAFVDG